MDLNVRALKANGARFSGDFLAYMVVATFLALFFLLYFNRLFASLASWALRTWTLHRYGIYIDIQAVQFSLLGGRIFFVGLRYHGTNETILIQNGHITWAYWLRRVRHIDLGRRRTSKGPDAEDIGGDSTKVHQKTKSKIPCRMNVTLAGLEWFVYNRSAAYDSIVASLTELCDYPDDGDPSPPAKDGVPRHSEDGQHKLRKRRFNNEDDRESKEGKEDREGGRSSEGGDGMAEKVAAFAEAMRGGRDKRAPGHRPGLSSASSSADSDRNADARRPSAPEAGESEGLPAFLQLLPIHFTCDRAAVVMGNENTSGILVVKTQVLSGEVDARHVETPDPYRQVFRLHFQKPVVEIRDNDDYREDQTSRAVREKQIAEDTAPLPPRSFFRHYRRTAYSQLRNLLPYFRSSVESFTSVDPRDPPATATSARMPGSTHWQGLSRYLDGPGGDEKTRWTATEYAMLNPILESPEAFLTMYWDSVGKVTASAVSGAGADPLRRPPDGHININGNEPAPAWGMALSIRGGSVNYGPWADRKRVELQRVFFPGLSKDAKPARPLPVGAPRAPTQFKVYVELDDEVTLRVPVREASKNWRFKGKDVGTKFQSARDKRKNRSRYKKSEPAPSASGQRPYGWLDIKISRNATIAYCMDMAASATGFCTTLTLDLPRVEIASSVNQQTLWRSGALRTSCDLSTPLQWNGLRQWRFHVTSNDLELFLLRDHVYLLTDLIDDWGTGPPAEYLAYTPFRYYIDLALPNVKLFLNVNDANIINNPTSFDDNTFIILASELLEASVCIPLDQFRAPSNAIPFSVQTDAATIQLHVPPWNTQSMFVRNKNVGHLRNLLVDGKYHYHAVTAPATNTDTLLLNVSGQKPTFHAYGFMVRYFIKLKDNYFGDDVHFTTLEEYQDSLRLKAADPDAERATRPPHKASNDLDVILSVHADDPTILLPAYIYSTSRHVQIDAASLAADLRFTNYYMDLDLVLPPLSLSLGVDAGGDHDKDDGDGPSSTELFVDGLHVYGNRLFGLPPTEPTYQCNWDLSVGAVTGECTTDFLTALAGGGKAFGFTFDDDENALIPYHSIVMYDITFLRVNVKSVSIWLHVEDAAFLLSLEEGVDVKYNDWARQLYSKRADIAIPDLQVSCVNAESAIRHKTRSSSAAVETDAFVKTSLSIAIVGRKFDFTHERSLQQELVHREDQRTNRARMLILPRFLDRGGFAPDPVDPPAQPVPPVPLPVTARDIGQDGISMSSRGTSVASRRRLRRRQSHRSFLSSAASVASAASQGSVFRTTGSAKSRQSSEMPRNSSSQGGGMQPLTPLETPGGGGQPSRLATAPHKRDISSSTRYSGFNSMGEYDASAAASRIHYQDPNHNTVAFSSKFFAPYFPLEDVKPDVTEAAAHWESDASYVGNGGTGSSRSGSGSGSGIDGLPSTDFGLDDVDPAILSEDMLQSSTLIRVHNGVSAFLNPASAKYIAALISALLPREPDDILDAVQISAIDGIIGATKRRKMSGRVQDIVVQLPRANVRFLNASSSAADLASSSMPLAGQDQYDVQVSNVTFMSRAKTTWCDAMRPEESQMYNSFQLRLGAIELSASERLADIATPQAAFVASVENVLVSMGTRDLAYLDADIGAVEGQLSSEKIEYIASLIHRTGVLASDLADAFAAPLSYNNQMRPHLAQRLIAAGIGVTDPGFLVRPSAVLRSAHEHLRTFDSWKLAMRLRQVWSLMKPEPKEQLMREFLGQAPLLPVVESPLSPAVVVVAPLGSTVRDVISKLEHWRGWDLGDLTRSLFLQELFGSLKTSLYKKAAEMWPVPAFMSVVRVEKLQLVLDPGPKQNEITYFDLTVRFENGAAVSSNVASSPRSPSGAVVGGGPVGESISVLNIFCSDSSMRLNWEICELAQDVIRLYKRRMVEKAAADAASGKAEAKNDDNGGNKNKSKNSKRPVSRSAASPKAPKQPAAVLPRTLHIVFAMDRGSLVLDTINLNVRMTSEGTKSSLLLRRTGIGRTVDTNFITSCDSITSRIKSHSELVLSSQLQRPGVFVAHSMQASKKLGRDEHTIKATASSRNFSFGVKQDPLALLETLDLLVRDEVAQLYQLGELFPLVPEKPKQQPQQQQQQQQAKADDGTGNGNGNGKIARHLSAFSFEVALFLEEYTISVPLLRSLTYKISGVVARVAVAAHFGKEVIFDFDVKENSHEMQVTSSTSKVARSISLLQIPPTNGRVTTRIGENEQTVSVFSSLELVQLDAAAVYSLLSALNRPEISSTIADMQQQLKVIQRHFEEIFDSNNNNVQRPRKPPLEQIPAPAAAKARPIVYSVHSTFAGLEIFGNVSPKAKSDTEPPIAHLLFCLDSIRLEITNRLDNGGPVLAYPEFYVNLRRIAFDILKGSEGQMASCGSMAFAARITATSKRGDDGKEKRAFDIKSDAFDVSLSPDTVSTVVDVLGYMGDKINDLDTSRELEYLRKLRQSKPRIVINDQEDADADAEEPDIIKSFFSSIAYTLEFRNIQVNWLCASAAAVAAIAANAPTTKARFLSVPLPGSSGSSSRDHEKEDLVLLFDRIELGTRTKNSARLTIENLQLQLVPPTHDKKQRSPNSALLPEVIFNVAYFSTSRTRRFAFQAVGKSLDLRLTSEFIVPAAHLKDSIQLSIKNVQQVSRRWNPVAGNGNGKSSGASSPSKAASAAAAAAAAATATSSTSTGSPQKLPVLGNKRLESLLVDVDFAGAVVYIGGKKAASSAGHSFGPAATAFGAPGGDGSTGARAGAGAGAGTARSRRSGIGGKYGQFNSDESGGSTTLRSPGLAWKLEYRDSGKGDPSLYAEVKIDPSSNVIYPSVVPLVMDLTASIKEVVSNSGKAPKLLPDQQSTADADEAEKTNEKTDEKTDDNVMAVAGLKPKPEESILMSAANPNAMLGRLKLNLGLRIHKQQFSLSCQPIARVAATTSFDDVYLTMNTIRTVEHGNFVAISGNISRLQASVQHVYSRESTGSFEVDSIVLSLMNSKHVSGVSGVSALLKVSPMKVAINVRQVQDFLLFREIWTPRDLRKADTAPISTPELPKETTAASASSTAASQQPVHLVQRYQQVAATAAFPWTASISIAALEINVDLGQALGKSVFAIEDFWVSSKKTSGWEQNLCLGFRRIGIDSTGRMSGFVALEDFRLRTSIEWPQREQALSKTPLIQASISFSQLRVKASFDYQAFLVADIQSLDFLMYNVRRGQGRGDRLVAVFEGDAVQVFGTTTSAAQSVALYQAFLRLVQERKANFETSLREIERFTNRRPSSSATQLLAGAGAGANVLGTAAKTAAAMAAAGSGSAVVVAADDEESLLAKSPISLDTDVVVTLRAVNLGVFPNTFADHQVFKMEALNAQARFTADIRNGRVHSNLGLTLGQLRIGLAGVRHIPTTTTTPDGPPKTISELSVEDVVLSATGSRGGTILKVPRVEASMQTWQQAESRQIDYIFKSAFEGKVEVGWNYSRISYIRGMWANHSRTLEQTFGREIPLAAIRVTGVPDSSTEDGAGLADEPAAASSSSKKGGGSNGSNSGKDGKDGKQTKITAEVNVPQSKYYYNALEPAIIETPQLRDMGEATPPLEWIGLHRDRLPNLTHQIVIVSLLELAGEVEDAYSRILGSS
ncbi:Macrophage colony-stimulating factor 1 receptor [Sporothrix curviconia]|uniref:Macrophage colony-stimulating factor 1 receptor n=1 Tax=Sporothrix curviconia TaxID=1260050 RepID=A0ABP0BNB3_9PEZI